MSEWKTTQLGDLAQITMGHSPASIHYNQTGKGIPLIQGNADINDQRKTALRNWTTEITKRCSVNDIIMTVRAPAGAIGKATFDACIGRGVCSIKYQNEYLYHYLIFKEKEWSKRSAGSTFDSVTGSEVKKFPVYHPSCIEEQKKIAAVLSDMDALIEAQQALIEKKQNVKSATMELLLTGKKRLPGFSGEWEEKELGEIASVKTGSKNNQDKKSNGNYPFFVRSPNIEKIDTYSYDGEAILIPGEGNIGKIFHYINGKYDVHQRVYNIYRFKPFVSPKFIHYYFIVFFGTHALSNSVKATVDSLRLPTFMDFKIKFPSIEEQKEITMVLDDLSDEISLLIIELEKFKNQKQAVMHKLLTGEIRLV